MEWSKLILLIQKKQKPKEVVPASPCGLSRSIIPLEYLKQFPIWEEQIASKTKIYI